MRNIPVYPSTMAERSCNKKQVCVRCSAAAARLLLQLLRTAGHAAIDRYLLATGPTTANPQQRRAVH